MSENVNGTVYCEHMIQRPDNVTVCSVWCRHFPARDEWDVGGPSRGVVCPYAEGQCVADHGPAPFLPTDPVRQGERTYANVETREAVERPLPPSHPLDEEVAAIAALGSTVRDALRAGILPGGGKPDAFERVRDEHLGEFERAADHGFTNVVRPTYAQRGAEYGDTWALDGLYSVADRLTDACALVRVKCRRVLGTGGIHRDSVLDLIAYASAYLAWGDANKGWWD